MSIPFKLIYRNLSHLFKRVSPQRNLMELSNQRILSIASQSLPYKYFIFFSQRVFISAESKTLQKIVGKPGSLELEDDIVSPTLEFQNWN